MEAMTFIKTNDVETAKLLREHGYEELSKEGSFFVFLNQHKKIDFADNKKIIYSNKILF